MGVENSNDRGIWAEDSLGNLRLIVRLGDLLDVSDDPSLPDLRTVASLDFEGGSGNEDGRRSGFNELGQLAFRAGFTDGSEGIFVSNLVAVPEPGAATILIAAIAGGALCRTQSRERN